MSKRKVVMKAKTSCINDIDCFLQLVIICLSLDTGLERGKKDFGQVRTTLKNTAPQVDSPNPWCRGATKIIFGRKDKIKSGTDDFP